MSGTAPQIQIQLPPPDVPISGPGGKVTREYLYVLLGLVQRTGGSGGTSITVLQQEIDALNALVAELTVLAGADMVPYPDAPQPDPLTAAIAIPPPDVAVFDNAVLLAQAIEIP